MLSRHAARIVLLAALFVFTAALKPVIGTEKSSPGEELRVTRVFYLQEIDVREAITMLRSQFHVRQLAMVSGSDTIIVTETPDKVDRCEGLLRELGSLARAAEPHEPLDFARNAAAEEDTRIYHIDGLDTKIVVSVMRAIYQIRQLTELAEKSSVIVTAPKARLDAIEALLQELDVLVEAKAPASR
jgi:type II secretory pathway component GspD/PulD (secretin)